METTTTILMLISGYFVSLDWTFICSFITLCYGINHAKARASLRKAVPFRLQTRFRVFLFGILYAIVLYIVRDYTLKQAEGLLHSLVFALVFHKLLIEVILHWLIQHGLPNELARHLATPEQINSLKKTQNETDK